MQSNVEVYIHIIHFIKFISHSKSKSQIVTTCAPMCKSMRFANKLTSNVAPIFVKSGMYRTIHLRSADVAPLNDELYYHNY